VSDSDRRGFLRLTGAAAAGAAATALAGCSGEGTPVADASPGPATPAASPGASGVPSPSATPGTSALAALPAQVTHGPRGTGKVALTFHGQGPAAMAEALLAAAEQGGAKITVLAVGSWLDQYPQMATRILGGGHELGNHTWHHLDIDSMDAAQARAEIEGCAARLRALTGSARTWFRPSQTQYATPLVERTARRAGYRTCLSYDLDSLDYTDPGPDAVVASVLGSVRGGSVVSMHLGHPGTVTALPQILHAFSERKLRAVTATELFT